MTLNIETFGDTPEVRYNMGDVYIEVGDNAYFVPPEDRRSIVRIAHHIQQILHNYFQEQQ